MHLRDYLEDEEINNSFQKTTYLVAKDYRSIVFFIYTNIFSYGRIWFVEQVIND